MPSLPKLKSFDWRIDVQTGSNYVSEMSVPCVLVQMEVEKEQTSNHTPFSFSREINSKKDDQIETITFELSQASLATMLEGLGKIRDQLNAVAKTS
jgi:COMM domain containing 9